MPHTHRTICIQTVYINRIPVIAYTTTQRMIPMIEQNLNIIFIVLTCFLVAIFLISILSKYVDEDIKERQKLNKQLDIIIDEKRNQIKDMDKVISTQKIDRNFNLSESVIKILNFYDHQSIRLPVDIMEELAYKSFRNESEIFEYIEIQRKNWKNECMKKPYRKDEKI